MKTAYDEKALVFCLRQGDKKAFEQMYRRFYTALLGVISCVVKNPIEAEDLLHDTYIKVWLRFDRYDPERGTLFNWLLNIARNTALDSIRRHKMVSFISLTEVSAMPTISSYSPVTDIIEVEHIVRQTLKPQQWEVIELAYWYGYTHPEIAQQLTLPLGTVKTRINQSLAQLRPLFGAIPKAKRSGPPYGRGV